MKVLDSGSCTGVMEEDVLVLKRYALKYLGVRENCVCKLVSNGSENNVLNIYLMYKHIHLHTNIHAQMKKRVRVNVARC